MSRKNKLSPRTIMHFGLLVIMAALVVFVVAPMARAEARNLLVLVRKVASLNAADIREIRICDRYSTDAILVITDPVALAEFTEALRDARVFSPNHPRYTRAYRIIVSGNANFTFTILFKQKQADGVHGDISENNARGWHIGTFVSHTLREWFIKYGPPRADDE